MCIVKCLGSFLFNFLFTAVSFFRSGELIGLILRKGRSALDLSLIFYLFLRSVLGITEFSLMDKLSDSVVERVFGGIFVSIWLAS